MAHPTVRDEHPISEPDAFEGLTGVQMLGTMDGIVDLITGFLRGTGLVTDTDGLDICSSTIRWGMMQNGWRLGNSSASGDHFDALFAFWDISYNIHPLFLHCRSWTYAFGVEIATKFDKLDDIRRIIVNIVNHVDEVTDVILDLEGFFNNKERG